MVSLLLWFKVDLAQVAQVEIPFALQLNYDPGYTIPVEFKKCRFGLHQRDAAEFISVSETKQF